MAIKKWLVFLAQGSRRLQISGLPRLVSVLVTASVIAGLAWTMIPVQPAHAAGSITVDRTDDPAVTVSGAGAAACTTAANDCSLRGATLYANANPGTTINIPAGTYQLTTDGASEGGNCGDATIGDLDINGNNTSIVGADAASTIIQQTQPDDRVICVGQYSSGNFDFSISGVTITGGREPYNIGGGGMYSGNHGGLTSVTGVVFSNNQTSGGSNAVGGGFANETGDLTVSNSTFGGSSAPCADQLNVNCANESYFDGGGLFYTDRESTVTETLTVTNSTFTNNVTTGGQGGGLTHTGALAGYTVSGSTFTGNQATATGARGGGLYSVYGPLTATNNTFTGNHANTAGNAISSSDVGGDDITANFNRIVGNTGSATAVWSGTDEINSIANNWWGCNGGPGAAGCDTVGGSTNNYSPWIVLKTTAPASTISSTQAVTLTTGFLQNSNNDVLTAGQIPALIGLPVSWTNAVNGSFSDQQTTIQANGEATATFTPSITSADCGASGQGEAKVDHVQDGDATATVTLTILCPNLTVLKSNNVSGTTEFGNNWTWTLHAANSASDASASFTSGQTILTDDLPNSGIAYGAPGAGNGTNITNIGNISCSIAGDTLICTATGPVSIGTSGSFDVTFSATPGAVTTFTNPRSGGACSVDPDNNVPETSESDNACNPNSVIVSQSNTTTGLISSVNPSVFGQSVTFTATVTVVAPGAGTPTGTVDFFDGVTLLGSATLDGSNQASFSTSNLSVASHGITAVYAGDTDFTGSTSPVLSQVVNQAGTSTGLISSSNPSVLGQSVTFTATVTANAPGAGTPTGTVDFYDGVTLLGGTALDFSGQATFTTSTLSIAGSPHSITAAYLGNSGFTGSTSGVLLQVINQADTTSALVSSANPSVLGQSVTFTATVTATPPGSGTPTGNVELFDGVTSLGTGTLDGTGKASFTTSTLLVASHSLTIVYAGDTNFTGSTSPVLSQVVNQAGTSTGVTSSLNPSVFGQSVTFTATVTVVVPGAGTPTGTVDFFDGVTLLGSGSLNGSEQASFTTSTLSASSHSITAVYAGDADFTGSTSAALSQVVNPAGTSTAMTSSLNPSVFGQSVTFTATVTVVAPGAGTPTGTVDFFDDVTLLGSGILNGSEQASFTTSTLTASASPHSITAVYAGDTNFVTSTSPAISQVVNPANTTTGLISSSNPSVFGESVTFTATVTAVAPGAGTPGGSVNIFDGVTLLGSATLDGSGQASFTTSTLSVASHSLTAVYAGDLNFVTSTSPAISQVVNQDDTSTTLGSSANPSMLGESVTFTATVTANAPGAGTPTGTVEFFDGVTSLGTGTLDGSGQATLATAALTIADSPHSITAAYLGDADFNTSTSAILSQVINLANTSTGVTSSLNPSVFGQSVTFTATVTVVAPGAGTPTGTVEFFNGVTSLGTGTLDGSGQASLATSSLPAAGSPHSITAVYSGDTDFATSTSSAIPQAVNPADTTIGLISSSNPSVFGESVTFTATVTAVAPGAGTPGGSVNFFDGVTLLGSATLDGSGQASFTTSSLSVSSHSLTAVYAGDLNFVTSTSPALSQGVDQDDTSTTLGSSANPSVLGQPVTFTATVTANAPGAGTPTGTVEFFDGVTSLGTGTLDGSGQATFTTSILSVSGSPHSITAHYGGDTNFVASASSVLSQAVNEAGTSTTLISSLNPSLSGDAVTFTATVTVTGLASGTPGGTVRFFDGAALLGSATLDGSGQASFTTSSLAASASAHSITAVYAGNADFSTSTSAPLAQVVNLPAAITSANGITFTTGAANTFTVTTTGIPAPALSQTGALPAGVTFTDNLDGTASLAGNPAAADAGSYPLVFTAHNGAGADATQDFTLIVDNTPAVVKINSLADTGDAQVVENEHTNVAITQLLVVFSNDMDSTQAQTGSNYTLVANGTTSITINSVTYDTPTKTATLNLNGGLLLPNGAYKLTVKTSLHDNAGIALAANFVRNFVIDTNSPVVNLNGVVGTPGNSIILNLASYTNHFTSLTVKFNKDVQNPADATLAQAVTNPDNYLLIQKGPDNLYDTKKCSDVVAGNPAGDDIKVPSGPVSYDNNGGAGPFVATVLINNGTPLPLGEYRLFICGTTSITDLAGNKLNGGADSLMTFTIRNPASGNASANAKAALPATGFAPDRVTPLASQPAEKAYSAMGDFWLEIPRLGVQMNIVGVPENGNSWDVSWLGDQAGWLNGTAYPTTAGNSVLTGHVYLPNGKPGPFVRLNTLWWGDQIIVHAGNVQYTYAVRSVEQVSPDSGSAAFKHETLPWLTLMTCRGYDQASNSYQYRVLVGAVLVSVK